MPSQRTFLLPAVAVFALAAGARGDDPKPKPGEKLSISERLAVRVTVEKAIEAPFNEVMDLFRTKYDIPVLVDELSIQGGANAMAGAVAFEHNVRLPKVANVRVDTLLRSVLDEVSASFLVYPDHVKVVTAAAVLYESRTIKDPREAAAEDPTAGEEAALLPQDQLNKHKPLTQKGLVNAAYKEKPLSEVLNDIAEATGANVVLAPQVGPSGRTAVTVRFANTPVDAAVRTLCEMTDLAAVADANVLLVTTRERAAARQKAEDDRRKAKQGAPQAVLIGGVGGGLGGMAPVTDVTAELAALKEQNEAMKKQLDEIQKLLKK